MQKANCQTLTVCFDWAGGNVWYDSEQYRNDYPPSNPQLPANLPNGHPANVAQRCFFLSSSSGGGRRRFERFIRSKPVGNDDRLLPIGGET